MASAAYATFQPVKDEVAMYESPIVKKEIDGVQISPPKSILKLRSTRTLFGFQPSQNSVVRFAENTSTDITTDEQEDEAKRSPFKRC